MLQDTGSLHCAVRITTCPVHAGMGLGTSEDDLGWVWVLVKIGMGRPEMSLGTRKIGMGRPGMGLGTSEDDLGWGW